MRRAKITTLTSNADATALETARLALDGTSGIAVLAGGQVSLTIAAPAGEQFASGDLVGFAYIPTTVNKDGSVTALQWHRWAAGDFTSIQGAPFQTKGPFDVPPGAARVIALPLAIVDSSGASTYACGLFFHAPSTIG